MMSTSPIRLPSKNLVFLKEAAWKISRNPTTNQTCPKKTATITSKPINSTKKMKQ